MGSELLNQIFEEDIILLSGGELDTELIEPEEDLNETPPYSIIDELMDDPPNFYTNHQTSIIFSTISTISHPLATMATTTTASTINTTPSTSTPTTIHSNMQQNTTAAYMQFTATLSTTTPSDRSSSTLSRPNYITDLNLPMKLAKLYRDIQLNAELSIMKVVEDHLKTQAKIKKTNKIRTRKLLLTNSGSPQ